VTATRKLIVTLLTELRSGIGPHGRWCLRRVEAVDADGNAIAESLITFAELPVGQAITVEVERREHPQHGVSYTLKLPRAGGGLGGRVDALERRVGALESQQQLGGPRA
jgi:hypothetical protein